MLRPASATHSRWPCITATMLCAWNTRQGVRCPDHTVGGVKLLENINNASQLCHLGSQPRGIILLGDSAGAHFHIPPEWITASQMSLVSHFGSHHPNALAFGFVSPLNVTPTPNRCEFSCSVKSAVKGTSFPVQFISDNVVRDGRASVQQAQHRSQRVHPRRERCPCLVERTLWPMGKHCPTAPLWGRGVPPKRLRV